MDTVAPTLHISAQNSSEFNLIVDIPEGFDQLIGRDLSVEVVIPDPAVSRRHARLSHDAGGVWLEDLSSANGTYVNGTRITDRCRLRDQDQVRFGESVAIFHDVANVADPTVVVDVSGGSVGVPPVGTTQEQPVRAVEAQPIRAVEAEPIGAVEGQPFEAIGMHSVEAGGMQRIDAAGRQTVETVAPQPLGAVETPPPGAAGPQPVETAGSPPVGTPWPPPGATAEPQPVATAWPPPGATAGPQPVEPVGDSPPGATAGPQPVETAWPPPGATAGPQPVETAWPPPGATAGPQPVEPVGDSPSGAPANDWQPPGPPGPGPPPAGPIDHDAVAATNCPSCGTKNPAELWFCARCGYQQRPISLQVAASTPRTIAASPDEFITSHGEVRRQPFQRAMRASNGGQRARYNEGLSGFTIAFRCLTVLLLLVVIIGGLVALAEGVTKHL